MTDVCYLVLNLFKDLIALIPDSPFMLIFGFAIIIAGFNLVIDISTIGLKRR